MDDLPGALIETTFIPEDVVAIKQDDGSVHLLMYVGKTDTGGYIHLKYAVIGAQHAQMFASPSAPALPDAVEVPHGGPPPPPAQTRFSDMLAPGEEDVPSGPRAPILDPDLLVSYGSG